VYAIAETPRGEQFTAWLETVEPYRFTAEAVVLALEQVIAQRPVGALTPSAALGVDFVLGINDTVRFPADG
jgi:hypothetical protein